MPACFFALLARLSGNIPQKTLPNQQFKARNGAISPHLACFAVQILKNSRRSSLIAVIFQRVTEFLTKTSLKKRKVTFGVKFMPQSKVYITAYQVGQVAN